MLNTYFKILRKLTFLLFIFAVFHGSTTIVAAYVRPGNPLMDYVPQNIGVYDTYYENFNETDCRVCHGASTAERHHVTHMLLV